MSEFTLLKRKIGLDHPTYFIADVAANHDGDLSRAKDLIYMCAEAGADAAKFQHFKAETIVSDYGFKDLGNQQSHQAGWKKSVFEVYKDASLNFDWTKQLMDTCKDAGIDFFTSPYSYELVDAVDEFIPTYKVGSGDITWTGIIERMASKGKPIFLATGASTIQDVVRAVEAVEKHTKDLCLMQCNTNYTASLENFKYISLNVLKTYATMFPDIVLGLSDHTPGHATVLGAVALGARAVEKHFTDDNNREGPDHKFSMNPQSWKEMVDRTRELEQALGSPIKKIEDNEVETVCLQRRSIRAKIDLKVGDKLSAENLEVLRPCPEDGMPPYELENIIGKEIINPIPKGEHVKWTSLK